MSDQNESRSSESSEDLEMPMLSINSRYQSEDNNYTEQTLDPMSITWENIDSGYYINCYIEYNSCIDISCTVYIYIYIYT